jgi:PAS domain S-box-containing protein
MPKISLRKLLVVGAVLVPIGLAILGLATVESLRRQIEASKAVRHTLDVIILAHKVDDHLVQMQTGTGDYVLFGEPGTLRAADQGYEAFRSDLRDLQGLVRDTPDQVVRLQSLSKAVEEWREGTATGAVRAADAGRRAEAAVLARESRSTMHDIRGRLGRFVQVEDQLLRRESQVHREAQRRTQMLLVAAGIVALAGGIVALVFYTRERRGAERALQQSEERLRAIMDHTVDGIITINERGVIQSFNKAAEQIFGYQADETIGKNVSLLMPSPYREVHDSFIESYLRTGRKKVIGIGQEVVGQRKDGTIFPMDLAVSEVRLSDLRLFTGIGRDISERKRAEQALEKVSRQLQAVLDSATQVSIIATDPQGVITVFNTGAERMLGYAAAEMIGTRTPAIIHVESEVVDHGKHLTEEFGVPITGFDVFVERARRGGYEEREWTYVRKDGTHLTVNLVVTALHDRHGTITGFLGIATDITERKAIERMKDEFVSIVSHELRTPLTSIRGSLDLLVSGVLGTLPEKGQLMLDIAVKSTDRLVRLINDILDIERIESGRVTLTREACDAAALMIQAGDVMRAMAEKAGVHLVVVPVGATLWADPDRTQQILTNLLSNAIKFSPPQGTVWLTASLEQEHVLFQVRDEGRGIPPDKLESIFERFQQVDASDSREKGGTGLGLAICKNIVQQHGGRIWADSTQGQGSTFFFTLPLFQERPAKQAESTLSQVPREESGVLLCGGDSSSRALIQRLLEQRSYRVIAVAPGENAAAKAIAERPAAILLDLTSPDRDGWTILGGLKKDALTRHIPVILFGDMGGGTRRPRASDGVVDRLGMPVDEAALIQAVEQAITHGGSEPRVLVVEDDRDLAQVLEAMFLRHGLKAIHAGTGQEAIELSRQQPPDLVVLDIGLPDVDGFAVVDWLRQQDRLHRLPLLVYTARDLDQADRARLQLGPTEFLTKSRVAPEEFEHRVVELMDRILLGKRIAKGGEERLSTREG